MRLLRTRKRKVMVGTGVALAVVLLAGGLANAATSPGTFTGCLKAGSLSQVAANSSTPAGGSCRKPAVQISWSATGPAGPTGPQGAIGPKGDTGGKGDTGAQGLQGAKGDTGAPGLQGATGDTGAPGLQGAKGDTGVAGAKGDPGSTGATGSIGPQGPVGPAGPAADAVNPNPYNLTYRLAADLGSGGSLSAVATGFVQMAELPVVIQSGALSSGRPQLSDLKVTLATSVDALRFLKPLNLGTALNSVTVEMCQQNETAGQCLLQLNLSNVFVTDVTYTNSPNDADATTTVSFAPKSETVTNHRPDGTRSVTYDVENNRVTSAGTVPAATAGAPFVTTLTGSPNVSIATGRWGHNITMAVKVDHGPIKAVTESGAGTVELLDRLLRGAPTNSITISGCHPGTCTQSVLLEDAYVTNVALGSATLTDKADLAYAKITVDRTEGSRQLRFSWNVLQSTLL